MRVHLRFLSLVVNKVPAIMDYELYHEDHDTQTRYGHMKTLHFRRVLLDTRLITSH